MKHMPNNVPSQSNNTGSNTNNLAPKATPPSSVTITYDSEFNIAITRKTTPRDIRDWVAKLEELVEMKKQRVRDDLAKQVNGLLADNEYTVEELLGARILPSTADLAEMAKKNKDAVKQRAGKMADTAM